MTALVFLENRPDGSARSSATVSLREWLGDHWAILFSHPSDFDQEQLERDRWLSVLGRTFSQQAVRPLALARSRHDARETPLGWLAELGQCRAGVLATAAPREGALLDFRANALRTEITRSGARFAMIIDSDLRCRRTMSYRMAVDLPSPIELLGWAAALRKRQQTAAYPLECALPAFSRRHAAPRSHGHALG